jgi:L-serine/L-threonine ammonia-lyase
VIVHGNIWDEAEQKAIELSQSLDSSFYVPPFNHPLIWIGHSTLIDELNEQLIGRIPDCIIASVGGGGLLLGLIEGLVRREWFKKKGFKLIAVETEGADCFNRSIKQGSIVTLDSITR